MQTHKEHEYKIGLESRFNGQIISIAIFFILVSCQYPINQNEKQSNIANKQQDTLHVNSKKITFILDSTINGIITLWDSHGTWEALGDLHSKLEKGIPEYIYFRNMKEDKYLKLNHLLGSNSNTFTYFEVGYVSNLQRNIKFYKSNFDDFMTENGINLGMSKDSLLKNLTKRNGERLLKKSKGENGFEVMTLYWEYELIYRSEFFFDKKGRLIKFGFGYDQP